MRSFLSLAIALFLMLLFASAQIASAVTVNITSPTSSSVGTSFTLKASASSSASITGWYVYIDNSAVWHGSGSSATSISVPLTVASGSHSLIVKAWDNTGAKGSDTLTLTASSSTSTSTSTSGALPTPPSTAKVYNHIEDMSGFKACSANCAGGRSTTNYWMAQYQSSPSLDGSSMEFFNGGNLWANVLWHKSLGANNWASHFLWDFYVYYNSSTIANLWVAEFDLYQSIAGWELMVGSQCNFGRGIWQIWNQASNDWIDTSIPCKRFSANTWHHIQWYVERASSKQYRYVTLVVDGKPYALNNKTFYGTYAGWADVVGVQWQLDLGPDGIDAHQWVDKVKLTIW